MEIKTASNQKTSFIIPFFSQRIDNLKQTIYFLKKEQIANKSELILVCQDQFEFFEITGFNSVKIIELNEINYCRSKSCNIGVNAATNEVIVLLDSDRILCPNYFTENCLKIKPKECITNEKIYQLDKPYSNFQIENREFNYRLDIRSRLNCMNKKGSISGNTIMLKSDYLEAGGMDESYLDYGYQDIDFARTLLTKSFDMIFLNKEEIHLFHEKISENFKINTLLNGIKYCVKWNLKPEKLLIQMGHQHNIDVLKAFHEKRLPKRF